MLWHHYPEDMTGITLTCGSKTINYEYKCREAAETGAAEVSAVVPPIETKVSLSTEAKDAEGYIHEGYAFSQCLH